MDLDDSLEIVRRWIEKESISDLKIAERLKDLGHTKKRESIRKWLRRMQKKGKLPVRTGGSRAGRPAGSKTKPKIHGAEFLPPESLADMRGLSLLEALAQGYAPSPVIEIVAPFLLNEIGNDLQVAAALEKADVQLIDADHVEGEIDVTVLALRMGREKVSGLSDLEYFLLALLQPTIRVSTAKGTTKWMSWVAREALEIKKTMRSAVML